jgi:hypothetical protein
MKNLLFLISALMLTLTPLTAQVEYGVKAGVNFADVYSTKVTFQLDGGDDIEDRPKSNTVVKPQLGVWVNIPINNSFSVQPELLFTQKAWRLEDVPEPATLSFNYVSLPLMMTYHSNNWRFEAGPEVSFLINQYFPESVGAPDNKNPFVDEQVSELAINAGIRYQFNRWQLGLRSSMDLTPFASFEFTDSNGEPAADNPQNFHHLGLQLALSYRL